MASAYEAIGGTEAVRRVAAAWHARCLADPVTSHPFSHPGLHPRHVERLTAYWGEALGGPAAYSRSLGDHSHVLRLHAGCGEHARLDRRCEQLFAHALNDAGIPADPQLRATLTGWFHRMTVAMAAYPESADDVPAGLTVPVLSARTAGPPPT
jgi:hemoglobin